MVFQNKASQYLNNSNCTQLANTIFGNSNVANSGSNLLSNSLDLSDPRGDSHAVD